MQAQPDLELLPAFVAHATPEELWAVDDLPGRLELHHTSPLTAGRRPFVLQCESFLPVFFPFFRHGGGEPFDHEEVRRLFRAILGSPRCLAILSHLPETLAELSAFLRDPAIDAKLVQTPVGMVEGTRRRLLAAPRAACADGPVFLFTNSAHQSLDSIPIRGGVAVLRFAERWLRAGRAGRFVFRMERPSDERLRDWGVDAGYLRAQEPARVRWIEDFLAPDAQLALFEQADVMLLPSVGLHSLTLMQAMAAGAVPVVTDTVGPGLFVEDERTGVVLRGVRDVAWERHAGSGILFDRFDRYLAHSAALARQLEERLVPLLASAHAVDALRERMRDRVRASFSGDAYRDAVTEEVLRRWRDRGAEGGRDESPSLLERAGAVRSSGWRAMFALPPMPRRRELVSGEHCFAGAGAFFRVRGRTLPPPECWSPFALARHGLLGRGATRIFDTPEALADDAATPAWREWLGRLRGD